VRTHQGPLGQKAAKIGVVLILTVYAAFTLFPVFMGVVNSLKTEGEILNNILALPALPQFGNYKVAFEKIHFFRSLLNTLLVVCVGVSGIVLFSAMAGYKLSRTPGRLSYLIFGLFVMSMLVPFHSIMITLTQVARTMGIQGSL
jgi:raffinose/stachyose/melibiose transport system permease protein